MSAVMKDGSYFKFIILMVSFSYFWLKPWFHVKIKFFYRILKCLVFYFNMEPCLTPTTRVPCSNAAKTRNPLNFAGCPKLANRSQPLVGLSSAYYEDMEEVLLLNRFLSIVDTCLSCEYIARQICGMVLRWRLFGDFFGSSVSSERRAAHFRHAF